MEKGEAVGIEWIQTQVLRDSIMKRNLVDEPRHIFFYKKKKKGILRCGDS
jgi:hypothetical protein